MLGIEPDWETEVRELHAFFEGWFTGELPPEAIERLEDAFHPSFTMVDPAGTVIVRAALIGDVAAAHGLGEVHIEVDNFHQLAVRDRLIVGRYDEWQHRARDGVVSINGRRSTAVFIPDRVAPCGVRWLTVHETAIPESARRLS